MNKTFSQIMVFISTILIILMFFFPDYRFVKKMILNRVDVITLLLVLGLYIKDLFRQG